MSAEPIAYLNGRFIRASELTLGYHDAGFVFGATITDFCRTYRHQLFRWKDHLARFRHDCEALRIHLTQSDSELTSAAEHLVSQNAQPLPEHEDLALVMFATPGPLGYMIGMPQDGPPTLAMHTFPLPLRRYARFFHEGVTLSVAGIHPFDPSDIVPGGIKHRSRVHWWLAHRSATEPGAVPVLLDQNGVADSAIGGLLAVHEQTVYRPPRGTVLESVSFTVVRELCSQLGLTFAEAPLDYRKLTEPLGSPTELLLVGSGFGLAGVRRFLAPQAAREFPWPGPIYQRLLAAWSGLVGFDITQQFPNVV